MNPRRDPHRSRGPRHLDRPRQWAQAPWLLLGMVFIAALLISSQRVASTESYQSDFSEPTGEIGGTAR